jgi:hypothetical protein
MFRLPWFPFYPCKICREAFGKAHLERKISSKRVSNKHANVQTNLWFQKYNIKKFKQEANLWALFFLLCNKKEPCLMFICLPPINMNINGTEIAHFDPPLPIYIWINP